MENEKVEYLINMINDMDIKDKLNEYIKNEYVNDNWIE